MRPILFSGPNCDWCHRKIEDSVSSTFGTTEGVRFCSESCFAQSRRATFKRAKACDWCRHIRHAVSYVDFQDGASQLQFCSDKCLNQYKMQIFVKETQAHLEMNPQLMEPVNGSDGNLITPELWMKNCHSRSASPESQVRSRSTSPYGTDKEASALRRDVTPTITSPLTNRPTITVAPVSKLLPPPVSSSTQNTILHPAELLSNRPSMKTMRKRRTLRSGPPVREHILPRPTSAESVKHNQIQQRQIPNGNKIPTHLEGSTRPQIINPFEGRFSSPPPNLFQIRPNLMSSQQGPPSMATHTSHLPHLPNLRSPSMNRDARVQMPLPPFLGSQVPPVTVLVPCPIIMPIPVPIPIPINIPEFLIKLLQMRNENPPTGSISPGRSHRPDTQESDLNNNLDMRGNTEGRGKSRQDREATDEESTIGHLEVQKNDTGSETSDNESASRNREVVPKIKITRLQSKRILTSRELDSTRPLRKRKRVVGIGSEI